MCWFYSGAYIAKDTCISSYKYEYTYRPFHDLYIPAGLNFDFDLKMTNFPGLEVIKLFF
jgi:hypothetical protein